MSIVKPPIAVRRATKELEARNYNILTATTEKGDTGSWYRLDYATHHEKNLPIHLAAAACRANRHLHVAEFRLADG